MSFEKKNRFQKEKNDVRAITDRAGIRWVPMWFTPKPPVLSKIYDRWKLKQTVFRLCRKEKFDLVHCRSYVAAEMGLGLKKKFKTKFLFDMRGFWADEKVDNGQWKQDRFFYRFIYKYYKKKEREFLLGADGITALTQAAKDYLLSKPEYRHLSIEVIPCCADLDHFDYRKISFSEITALKHKLGIPVTAKVITYLGSLGGWYLTHEMFSFFKILIDQNPEYVMLILTMDNAEKIREEALRAGITHDKMFLTYAQREELPPYLALSTCGIFFIRNTLSKIASSPTKHAEMMGMGIPVVCNNIGDTGNIIGSTQTGIVVDDFSVSSLSSAARRINALEAIDKGHIRNCAKNIFDLRTGVLKYSLVYKKIFEAGDSATIFSPEGNDSI